MSESTAHEARVEVYDDVRAVARAAARRFEECARLSTRARDRFDVALSGGSTPALLFSELARPERAARIAWDRTHVYWGDERHVPADHADSNYAAAARLLLDHVPIPPNHVHRIPTELGDAAQVAEAYESILRAELDTNESGWPRFDLVFLGMGDDGHTASLFPRTSALDESSRWVVASHVETISANRVTLTVPVLNAATQVVFLASGAGKAAALDAVLEGPRRPRDLPAQFIDPTPGSLSWLVDRAAAADLPI